MFRLVQQIYCLLEPFILNECSICPLCCLDRRMAEQMLNICNCGTPTQQSSSKCLSHVV
jgi:hypothetical protein